MYTKAFKRILYLQMAQLLTGTDVCPTTVQVCPRSTRSCLSSEIYVFVVCMS